MGSQRLDVSELQGWGLEGKGAGAAYLSWLASFGMYESEGNMHACISICCCLLLVCQQMYAYCTAAVHMLLYCCVHFGTLTRELLTR